MPHLLEAYRVRPHLTRSGTAANAGLSAFAKLLRREQTLCRDEG